MKLDWGQLERWKVDDKVSDGLRGREKEMDVTLLQMTTTNHHLHTYLPTYVPRQG